MEGFVQGGIGTGGKGVFRSNGNGNGRERCVQGEPILMHSSKDFFFDYLVQDPPVASLPLHLSSIL